MVAEVDLRYWADQGYGSCYIAGKLGVSDTTIRKWARRYGVKLQRTPTALLLDAKLARQERDRLAPDVRRLAADGYGPCAIGEVLGTTRDRIIRIAEEHGIQLPARTKATISTSTPGFMEARKAAGITMSEFVHWNGQRVRLKDRANELGITTPWLKKRIAKYGIDVAMTMPKRCDR